VRTAPRRWNQYRRCVLPFLLIGLSLVAGWIGYLLIIKIEDRRVTARVIAPRHLPDDMESVAASGLGLTFVSTVLASGAAIASITLDGATAAFQFWWYVGWIPAVLQFITGTWDGLRIVYPLRQGVLSWGMVASYYASSALFAWSTFVSLNS